MYMFYGPEKHELKMTLKYGDMSRLEITVVRGRVVRHDLTRGFTKAGELWPDGDLNLICALVACL